MMFLFSNEISQVSALLERINALSQLTPEQQQSLGLPTGQQDVFNPTSDAVKTAAVLITKFEVAASDDTDDVIGWIAWSATGDEWAFEPNADRELQ